MYEFSDTLPDGQKYVLGICVFCHNSFNEETSGGYFYGHQSCAEDFERDCNRRYMIDLIASCPVGTRFDIAGGAASN